MNTNIIRLSDTLRSSYSNFTRHKYSAMQVCELELSLFDPQDIRISIL
jgi:hypothetical protein